MHRACVQRAVSAVVSASSRIASRARLRVTCNFAYAHVRCAAPDRSLSGPWQDACAHPSSPRYSKPKPPCPTRTRTGVRANLPPRARQPGSVHRSDTLTEARPRSLATARGCTPNVKVHCNGACRPSCARAAAPCCVSRSRRADPTPHSDAQRS
ncbi:hypothetical protein GY45DRAFT_182744 [Cubamyces sp. BRFM 1775]|nr:hypothetical protein GY45DRAFT_182744 [Cubamyces sp. BRFM 1775]